MVQSKKILSLARFNRDHIYLEFQPFEVQHLVTEPKPCDLANYRKNL